MYILKYSERVYMARMHELASASPPYERLQYDSTFLRPVQYDRTFLDSVQYGNLLNVFTNAI